MAGNGKSENLQEKKNKTVIPKLLKTKFNEIDFQQEEPY